MSEVSQILEAIQNGDSCAADRLFPMVYDELRTMAQAKLACEKAFDSMQATALVHEAYLRMVGEETDKNFRNRRYFFGAAAEAMRRILVDRARKRASVRNGGMHSRINFFEVATMPEDTELVALDQALANLALEDSIAAEVVNFKFFAGLSRQAIADLLQLSIHEVRMKWDYARAWLQVAISQ